LEEKFSVKEREIAAISSKAMTITPTLVLPPQGGWNKGAGMTYKKEGIAALSSKARNERGRRI